MNLNIVWLNVKFDVYFAKSNDTTFTSDRLKTKLNELKQHSIFGKIEWLSDLIGFSFAEIYRENLSYFCIVR